MKQTLNISESLVNKYNVAGPRYTSYPPANFFLNTFTKTDYEKALIKSNTHGESDMSLYIHIPFCHSLCLFCGCTTRICPPEQEIKNYLDALEVEIRKVSTLLDLSRKVMQIHWGGGTPHSIGEEGVERVMKIIYDLFSVHPNAEVAMECHPGYVDFPFFDFLKDLGFNRVSLGVQDYSERVLDVIHRKSPLRPLDETVSYLKKIGLRTNFDLVYGLPGQTTEDFIYSIEQTIKARPHRIATFSYAHVPWVKKAQEILSKVNRIEGSEKWNMLYHAYSELTNSGYIAVGMDHFSLPDDDLVEAKNNQTLYRNFQGYTAVPAQVYAFGSSGITQLQGCYAQNKKGTHDYVTAISTGFATERGYILSDEEQIYGKVIAKIMCNSEVDLTPLLDIHDVDLKDLSEDGMLSYKAPILKITEQGRFFVRNIAMKCDPMLNTTNSYSKTI